MGSWYVKELAKISGISVQTLHHYDHIGLLKPSDHSSKGYRIYNQADLIKLQQIIALKFFGFELKQIKNLLAGDVSLLEHFLAQASFLEAKAQALLEASSALKKVIKEVRDTSSLPWESIINLIEVYRMTTKLENAWVRQVLSPEELKQYVQFEKGLKSRFSEREKAAFHQDWALLVDEIKNNLNTDPKSKLGMELAEGVMKLINNLYTDEHANLRHIIWEKGFKTGQADVAHSMSAEMVSWLDMAMHAYYSQRIYALLKQVGQKPNEVMSKEWQALMTEMFSNSKDREHDAVNQMLNNPNINDTAKNWLKLFYKKS